MRVLLVDDDDSEVAPLADALAESGIEVARCHDPGRPSFPCHGLVDHRDCPLDRSPIDAVVARSVDAGANNDAAGTRCALRQYVPLVLVGDRSRSPLAPFAASFADAPSEVADAVRAAVAAPLAVHEEAAARTLRLVLDRHGLVDVAAAASVTRDGDSLRVQLQPSRAIPDQVAEVACVRVAGALRAIDTSSACLNVGVVDPTH